MDKAASGDDVRYVPRRQADGMFVINDRRKGDYITDDRGYEVRFTKASAIEICRRLNSD